MYRPEIKVLDCTIRDGGLMNKWNFSDDFVKAVYQTCVDAGIDYMEIGYKTSEKYFSKKEFGKWKFCDEEDVRAIVGENNTDLKLSVMVDIGRIDPEDIQPRSESVIDMVRVACYVNQVDKAIWLAEHCIDKGYETTINIMAVSTAMERDLNEALEDINKSRVPIVYLVDSYGSMYCEQVEMLVRKYQERLPGKTIGVHMHNNMQLAFSNTITGIIHNCNMLDATFLGIGRGAGNCPMEILLSFLKNPKFKLRPVFKFIQEYMLPLQNQIEWGYHIPYLITGSMNEHPRSAIKWMESDKKNDLLGFYEYIIDQKHV